MKTQEIGTSIISLSHYHMLRTFASPSVNDCTEQELSLRTQSAKVAGLNKCNLKNESQFFLQSRRCWCYLSDNITWAMRANKFPLLSPHFFKELSFPPTLYFQRGSYSDYFNTVLRKMDALNAIKLKYCRKSWFIDVFLPAFSPLQDASTVSTSFLHHIPHKHASCSFCACRNSSVTSINLLLHRVWSKFSYGSFTTTGVDCLYFFFYCVYNHLSRKLNTPTSTLTYIFNLAAICNSIPKNQFDVCGRSFLQRKKELSTII